MLSIWDKFHKHNVEGNLKRKLQEDTYKMTPCILRLKTQSKTTCGHGGIRWSEDCPPRKQV